MGRWRGLRQGHCEANSGGAGSFSSHGGHQRPECHLAATAQRGLPRPWASLLTRRPWPWSCPSWRWWCGTCGGQGWVDPPAHPKPAGLLPQLPTGCDVWLDPKGQARRCGCGEASGTTTGTRQPCIHPVTFSESGLCAQRNPTQLNATAFQSSFSSPLPALGVLSVRKSQASAPPPPPPAGTWCFEPFLPHTTLAKGDYPREVSTWASVPADLPCWRGHPNPPPGSCRRSVLGDDFPGGGWGGGRSPPPHRQRGVGPTPAPPTPEGGGSGGSGWSRTSSRTRTSASQRTWRGGPPTAPRRAPSAVGSPSPPRPWRPSWRPLPRGGALPELHPPPQPQPCLLDRASGRFSGGLLSSSCFCFWRFRNSVGVHCLTPEFKQQFVGGGV